MIHQQLSAIYIPGMSEADWQDELNAAIDRSIILNEFLKGHVTSDSFLDWIAENFADPLDVLWVP